MSGVEGQREGCVFFVDERFLARMMRDGGLTIPKLTFRLLQEGEEESLEGCVLEVTVEPADV